MINYLLIIIGIIWLVFASIFDIKKREIPDWLNYSLIIIGLGLRFMHSFFDNYLVFLYGLIGVAIAFVFGSALYYARQWGGGDAKLLMGMGAMFGSNMGFVDLSLPFFLVLIINIFIVGAATGIIYGIVLAFLNRKKFLKEFKILDFKFAYATLVFIIFLILFGFFFDNLLLMVLLSAILLFMVSLFGFMKAVEKSSMHKMVNVSKLNEGDLLVNDIIHRKKLIVSYKIPGLTIEHIKKIRMLGIKNVLIKEGMPFSPNFLIGFLITLSYGSLLSLLW